MAEQRKTKLGTPCSPKWDEAWVAQVDYVERQLDHRICGAHSPAWTPCKLASTHANGRCRFHGGAAGIGAPKGNRNAMIHGLYSRRLQQCGDHCPLWQMCPMAGKDVAALPHKERPYCVYEEREYEALTFLLEKKKVSKEKSMASAAAYGAPDTDWDTTEDPDESEFDDAMDAESEDVDADPYHPAGRSPETSAACDATASDDADDFFLPTFSFSKEKVGDGSPAVPLLHHNVAMFQVMLTRAQAALGWQRYVEETRAESEGYTMKSPKVSALLQAELRIARELRQWLRLLAYEPLRKVLGLKDPGGEDKPFNLPDFMKPILEEAEGVLEYALEPKKRRPRPDDPEPAPA